MDSGQSGAGSGGPKRPFPQQLSEPACLGGESLQWVECRHGVLEISYLKQVGR